MRYIACGVLAGIWEATVALYSMGTDILRSDDTFSHDHLYIYSHVPAREKNE